MIFSFESLKNKIQNESKEIISNVVLAKSYGNNCLLIFLYLFINYYLLFIPVISMYVYYAEFFVVLVIFYIIFSSKKVGIGLSKNSLIYVKFGLSYKTKKVYNVPLDSIKYLDVKKVLNLTLVNMSFIDSDGHFVKLKFYYTGIVIGLSTTLQKKNGLLISKKLKEIQKVLDKGDF